MKPDEDDTTESYSKLWAIASENPNTTQEYQVTEKVPVYESAVI